MADLGLPDAPVTEKDPTAQLRGSALWMLSAFVAIDAAQVVAISLSGLSDVAGSLVAVILAVLGFVLAVGGIGVGIKAASSLLKPVEYTPMQHWGDDVNTYGATDVSVLIGPLGNLKMFQTRYIRLRKRLQRLDLTISEREALRKTYDSYVQDYGRWVEYRKLQMLEERYRTSIKEIIWGACGTLAGIVLFNVSPLVCD